MRAWYLAPAALILAAGCAPPAQPAPPAASSATGRYVDLTHPLNEESIFWPTAEKFHLEKVADGSTEKGYHYAANNFCTAEHGGTHLDAPVHFAKGGWTTDQIPLDRLIGRAVVVDVARESAANRTTRWRARLRGLGKGSRAHRA